MIRVAETRSESGQGRDSAAQKPSFYRTGEEKKRYETIGRLLGEVARVEYLKR